MSLPGADRDVPFCKCQAMSQMGSSAAAFSLWRPSSACGGPPRATGCCAELWIRWERGPSFPPSLPRSFLRFVFLPYASLVRFPTGTQPRPPARRRVDRRGRCGGSGGRSSFQGMDDGERPTFRARLPPAPGDMNDMLYSANNLGGRYDGVPELFLLHNKRITNEL